MHWRIQPAHINPSLDRKLLNNYPALPWNHPGNTLESPWLKPHPSAVSPGGRSASGVIVIVHLLSTWPNSCGMSKRLPAYPAYTCRRACRASAKAQSGWQDDYAHRQFLLIGLRRQRPTTPTGPRRKEKGVSQPQWEARNKNKMTEPFHPLPILFIRMLLWQPRVLIICIGVGMDPCTLHGGWEARSK